MLKRSREGAEISRADSLSGAGKLSSIETVEPESRYKRELTGKQELFVRHYTDPSSTGFSNATRAAGLAGYRGGGNQLGVQGHWTLKNPKVREKIRQILTDAGCSPERAARRLNESLDAVRVQTLITKEGVRSQALPDFRERRQAAELVLRLHGLLGECPDEFSDDLVEEDSPLAKQFRRLNALDQNLIREAIENFIEMIEDQKAAILKERGGLSLEEADRQLQVEAVERVEQMIGAENLDPQLQSLETFNGPPKSQDHETASCESRTSKSQRSLILDG
jgi:Terminase small subunit